MSQIVYDYTQADWDYSHPRPFTKHTPIRVELHHSVIPADRFTTTEHAEAIQQEHLDRGWNGIFYNVGVNPLNGEVIECRGEGNLSTSDARDALTVCVFGDLRTDRIGQQATDSLLRIIAAYPATPRGHRERPYPTACPADHGIDWLNTYRSGGFDPPPPQEENGMTDEQFKILAGGINDLRVRVGRLESQLQEHDNDLDLFIEKPFHKGTTGTDSGWRGMNRKIDELWRHLVPDQTG